LRESQVVHRTRPQGDGVVQVFYGVPSGMQEAAQKYSTGIIAGLRGVQGAIDAK